MNDDDLLLYAKADLTDSEEDSSVSEGLSAGPETKKRKRKTLGRMEKQKRRKLNPTSAPKANHHPEHPGDTRNQIASDCRLMARKRNGSKETLRLLPGKLFGSGTRNSGKASGFALEERPMLWRIIWARFIMHYRYCSRPRIS